MQAGAVRVITEKIKVVLAGEQKKFRNLLPLPLFQKKRFWTSSTKFRRQL